MMFALGVMRAGEKSFLVVCAKMEDVIAHALPVGCLLQKAETSTIRPVAFVSLPVPVPLGKIPCSGSSRYNIPDTLRQTPYRCWSGRMSMFYRWFPRLRWDGT